MENASRLTQAAYQCLLGGPLDPDKAFYDGVAGTARGAPEGKRQLLEEFLVPIRSGRAWTVPEGAVFRISTPEGPQVGDLNLWNMHNPRERLWASRTRQLQKAHVSTYDRLWSTLPYLRPLCTIVADSLAGYGADAEGGRIHDLLGTRCDPYVNKMLTGQEFDYCCHSNLTRAVVPFGLTELDVHDVLNVFQCTGLNSADQYFMKSSPALGAPAPSYVEFFAEQPLLCALSTCPGGDLSLPMWGDGAGTQGGGDEALGTCRPLKVEVWRLHGDVLEGWKPWSQERYAGGHALKPVEWATASK